MEFTRDTATLSPMGIVDASVAAASEVTPVSDPPSGNVRRYASVVYSALGGIPVRTHRFL